MTAAVETAIIMITIIIIVLFEEMHMVKHSKQRDAIIDKLSGRRDHPTAETLYRELKLDNPSLSLATVYRNLKQLESWGDIVSISTSGASRYDFNTRPHSHFFCIECGAVCDLDDDNEEFVRMADKKYDGTVLSCSANFFGICPECLSKVKG